MEGLDAENERLRRRLREIEAESSQLAQRLQELVSDSEARFAAIFRDAPIGIMLMGVDGRVVMANPSASRILGYSQAELRGLPVSELLSSLPPEDLAQYSELSQGRRDRSRFERPFSRGDGSTGWASLSISLIRSNQGDPEYALALLEDVTERKESEENARRLLAEQAARAESEAARRRIVFLAEASAALASSLDINATLIKLARLAVPALGDYCLVDVKDPQGAILRTAEAAVDEAVEAVLRDIARAPNHRTRPGIIREVLNSGRTRLVTSVDGSPLTAESGPPDFDRVGGAVGPSALLLVPLLGAARSIGVITFGWVGRSAPHSESDVALAEEFARRAAMAIDNAQLYQEATEANRLKDDFLAIVSHELRTPLTPILGWAQLLRTARPDPETLEAGLNTIERNARAQSRLVDDLLDVSQITSGKLRLDTRPMNLGPLVEEAVDSVRAAAKAKNIKLVMNLDPAAPQVMGDPTRLLQVTWNLVSNAIKFTPQGGRVEVGVRADQGRTILEVTDTGEGIHSEFVPHLFQRFRQSEAAITRRHGGLGLGLSIVRHLVELHGGTVSAQSAGPGHGSSFLVQLPAAPSEAFAPQVATQHKSRPDGAPPRAAARLDGLEVVVVDDHPDALRLIAQVLEQLGAKVVAADSAARALQAIAQRLPDVLVSDLAMPNEDGLSLIRKVRKLPPAKGGRLPAVALTAFARAEDRIRALEAGFQSHVPKPVDATELAAVLTSLCPPPASRRPAVKTGAVQRRKRRPPKS